MLLIKDSVIIFDLIKWTRTILIAYFYNLLCVNYVNYVNYVN